MDSFNDIKDLWQNQPQAQIPDVAEIEKAVNKSRRQMIIKNVLGLVTLGGTLVFIGYIGMVADFKFVTTRLGIVLIMISIIAALIVNSQLLMLILNGKDSALDNHIRPKAVQKQEKKINDLIAQIKSVSAQLDK